MCIKDLSPCDVTKGINGARKQGQQCHYWDKIKQKKLDSKDFESAQKFL